MQSGDTVVFGHRGAMAYAPMNTLAAFELAHQQGAAGIELDLHLSKDGCPVVIHNATVDETTDGQGAVADKSLLELKALDAGGWFADDLAGEQIPDLDEVFESLGKKLLINVEIKSVPNIKGLVQATAASIKRHRMQERVLVSSFNPCVLQRFSQAMPCLMLALLYMPQIQTDVDAMLPDLPYQALHPWHSIIDASYMQRARQNGCYVNAWTVNHPERARELQRLGINGLITDCPDLIAAALA